MNVSDCQSAYLISGDSFALGASKRSFQMRLEFLSRIGSNSKVKGTSSRGQKGEVLPRLFCGRHFAFSDNFSEEKHARLKKELTQLLVLAQGVVHTEIPDLQPSASQPTPFIYVLLPTPEPQPLRSVFILFFQHKKTTKPQKPLTHYA